MQPNEGFLRERLAQLYPSTEDQLRILHRAGLSPSRIPLGATALNTWFSILREAANQDRLEALLDAVKADRGEDPDLRAAIGRYRSASMDPGNAKLDLCDLLSNLFGPEDLRRFAHFFDDDLAKAVAWDRALLDTSFQVVRWLEANGRLGPEFFQALLRERPGRTSEIRAVAAALGVSLASEITPLSAPVRATRVLCVLLQLDSTAYTRFCSFAAPLTQRGILQIEVAWTAADLTEAWPRSDIAVVMLTAEFLASELSSATLERLETSWGHCVFLGVVLRPCLWQRTGFAVYTLTSIEPIESSTTPDQAWADLVRRVAEIAELAREQPEATARDGFAVHREAVSPRSALAWRQDSADLTDLPLSAVPIHDVFSSTGFRELTFVETDQLKRLEYELGYAGKALVIQGPSGTGKTCTTRTAIDRLRGSGRSNWPDEYYQCKADADRLAAMLATPLRDLRGFLVLDDFHELDGGQRRQIGRITKALLDLPTQNAKFVLVGINGVGSLLIEGIPDLGGGRTATIEFGRQPNELVARMISRGEAALQVRFSAKQDIVDDARGSLMLAQLICERMLLYQQIYETQPVLRTVSTRVHEVRVEILKDLRDQFHRRLQEFCALDDAASQRGAGIALLWRLGQSADGSLSMEDVRARHQDIDVAFDVLLENAKHGGSWRELVFCSAEEGRLALADPKLGFYLRQINWTQFAADCGVSITLSVEQGPVFLEAAPAVAASARPDVDRSAVGVIRVLHLSDFHFRTGTSWDSTTVLGRLARDIAELRQQDQKADLLVLTGDVAFSGQRAEYDLAARWIRAELLPSAGLTENELIVVPGNHDVDRKSISFTARAVQDKLLEDASDARFAAVLSNADDRGVLLARHVAFLEFLNKIKACSRTWTVPWGSVSHTIRGKTVQTAALCSSFMSGADDERGKLVLSLWQANELLRGAEAADVVISAMHHPWSWFTEFDEPARIEVRRASHVVLRGHLHDANVEQLSKPRAAGPVEIAAGASYESSHLTNGYNFIEIDLNADEVRIWPRMWNARRRTWQLDRNLFEADFGRLPLGRLAGVGHGLAGAIRSRRG